jgi:hypothetical protein
MKIGMLVSYYLRSLPGLEALGTGRAGYVYNRQQTWLDR